MAHTMFDAQAALQAVKAAGLGDQVRVLLDWHAQCWKHDLQGHQRRLADLHERLDEMASTNADLHVQACDAANDIMTESAVAGALTAGALKMADNLEPVTLPALPPFPRTPPPATSVRR